MIKAPGFIAGASVLVAASLGLLLRVAVSHPSSPQRSSSLLPWQAPTSPNGTDDSLARSGVQAASFELPAKLVDDSAAQAETLRTLWRTSKEDKPRALQLALQADAHAPTTGKLAEARKAMIITLLVELGRMDEARDAVRRYIANYPKSEYRAVVQGMTGVHPRPWGPDGSDER